MAPSVANDPDPALIDQWRPQSLRAAPTPWISARWRFAAISAITLLHVFAGIFLLRAMGTRPPAPEEVVMLLDFSQLPPTALEQPRQRIETSPPTPPVRRKPRPAQTAQPMQAMPSPAPRDSSPSAPAQTNQQRRPLDLYTPEGRLRVPADMLDQIDRKYGDKRDFSYQVPRLDDARKLFRRNAAISYEPTRFDEYWKPDQDLLTDVLTKLVEKTTKEVRIPVPGRPGSTMVCQISLLALGGGCGVMMNGSDYNGPVDDPATLSDEEDRQCQAWWQQIVGARTQDVWRRTRDRYDAECRKPRLSERAG